MEILLGSSIWSDLVDPLCAFRDGADPDAAACGEAG